jgi:ATP-dependent Clp protease ATP-binding subunit ClpA
MEDLPDKQISMDWYQNEKEYDGSMFELFTERAIDVVTLAQDEAIEIGYRSIGTEDLLLGLLRQGTSSLAARKPGLASMALKSEGVILGKTRKAVQQFRRQDKQAGSVEFQLVGNTYAKVTNLEFTEHANQLQVAAKNYAISRGEKQIGTAHLLIGLLSLDDCNGNKVLQHLKVDCERLRKNVVNLLDTSKDSD